MWTKKSFLIIGGSSGIGLEVVRRLAELGAGVTVWSRSVSEEFEELGVRHVAVDVTGDVGAAEIPEELDGFAYFPGTINLAPFERIRDEVFRSDLEVNVLGAVRTLQRAMPVLAKSGGSVVMTSTVAVGQGMPYHASIAAAKGAVEGLVRSLAAEYASRGVRVNAVAPSLTDTPLAERLLNSDQKRERASGLHPLGRVGVAGDIAGAALYLLGDESSWVTGQVLHVDGGMSSIRPN
jgi:NAD(P)-dependent dehydrogenase (short-subunit alcohol dehydrogenase family)